MHKFARDCSALVVRSDVCICTFVSSELCISCIRCIYE